MKKPSVAPAPYVDAYRAEDDARTLSRAGEIMGDKTRHKAAAGHMQKQMAGMQRVMGAAPPAKPPPGKPPARPPPPPPKRGGASLGFAKGKK